MLRQTSCAEVGERVVVPAGERVHPGAEYLVGAVGRGEPHGRWLGEGVAALGLYPGQVASEDLVRQVFGRLEHPRTGEPLGRPPMKFRSPTDRLAAALAAEPNASPERTAELTRQINSTQKKAVGYYDLTFSPAKSVSVYYAALMVAGRTDDAEKVWEAHRAAVTAALAYLEREAGYSRSGYHGRTRDGRSVGDYVEARQWVAARFDHTTNREHQPQLHSHVELLNRVQCEADGVWRAVDGKALYAEKRGADSIYELTLQQTIMRDLPVLFTAREDGMAHEIAGITAEVRDAFSAGAARIQARVGEWVTEYEERHGRSPSAYERVKAAERAAMTTRPAKTDGPADLVAEWAGHADLLAPLLAAERTQWVPQQVDRDAVIRAAVERVKQEHPSWTRSDLMLEVKRELDGRHVTGAGPEAVITGLADEALTPGSGYGLVPLTALDPVLVPSELRRESDDRSRFRPHRDERFCTADQLSAEERLVATARAGGAPALTEEQLVIAEAELAARGLGDDQIAAVLRVMGSGRRGDVLIGPAGAGKSYTTGAIAELWEHHYGPVLGLATGQSAANLLTEEGLSALNVAAFLALYEPDARTGSPARELPNCALLVIDEAGMSNTEQLDRVRQLTEQAGAKMLWAGDPEQLDSVGAGGVLRLLATDVPVSELREVHRFREAWEKEASLGLREGDPSALAEYDNRGRIFEGTAEQMRDAAYQGYLADILSGKQSVLLTSRNDQAAALSAQVRAKLVELGRVNADGAALRDGTSAGIGDLIQTRQGDRQLRSETGRWVANRDVWTVTARDGDDLTVALQQDPSVTLTLPAAYVAQSVTLAYASTSHAAQGRTVDTGHSLVDVSMSRNELYPNMTRGRDGNWAYTVTHAERDDEQRTESLHSNRMAVLAEVLDRDTAQRAALQVMREEIDASRSLASMGTMWAKVVGEQAADRYADILLGALGSERMDRLVKEQGAGRMWRTVRNAELAGHDPAAALTAAVERGDLSDADSLSDVLRWRVANSVGAGQVPARSWQDRTPVVDSEIGRYTSKLARHMDARQHELGEQVAAEPTAWAVQHLGPVPEAGAAARPEWEARAAAVAAWRELANVPDVGASVLGAAPSREMPEQRAAWHAAYTALGADEAGRDYAAASDDELRATVAQHEREKDWAPAHVAPLLGIAERGATTNQRQAVLLAAEAAAATTPDVRAEREQQAQRKAAVAAQLTARADRLGVIHEARELWRDHTAAHAEAADMSQRELARRDGTDEPVQVPGSGQDLRDPRTTEVDLAAAVARSHAATERILEDRAAAAEVEQRASEEPARTAPERSGSSPDRSTDGPVTVGGGDERGDDDGR